MARTRHRRRRHRRKKKKRRSSSRKQEILGTVERIGGFLSVFGRVLIFCVEYIFISSILHPIIGMFGIPRYEDTLPHCQSVSGVPSSWLLCVLGREYDALGLSLLVVVLFAVGFCVWFSWRFGVSMSQSVDVRISKTCMAVIFLLVGANYVLFRTRPGLFRWDNFTKDITIDPLSGLSSEKSVPVIRWDNIFQVLFASPIIEEFVLRVFLLTDLRRRLPKNDSLTPVMTVNAIFSILHIMNSLYYASYAFTLLQCLSAFVVGLFYSTRFLHTGNLFEPLLLHLLNNVVGIFMPIRTKAEGLKEYLVPIAVSLSIYLVFLIKDVADAARKTSDGLDESAAEE